MENIEDSDFVAPEHDRLISAVSKFDKTQHITEPTRSEPTNIHSEFNLIKRSNKLNLENVAKVLGDTAKHVYISKKLKKGQNLSNVLHKPLEKPQAERIKRSTGYEVTKKKVGRWDPVVARSRTADYSVFPIKPVETKMQPTKEFLSRFELKSQLEKELEEVDPPASIKEDEEEDKIYPMSYEEMVEHRKQAAKLRAQQSYKEAKAKRQSKIKSKKYHRVLKKERLKLQLKEFEEMQKTDPEEALKQLESLEKARALERHTLRHKNTGKWAKNKMIRAKYDKDVRQQLAEQLAVSRGLTKKVQDVESSDDGGDDTENIPDLTLAQDPMNPWMMKQSDKSNINAEFDFGYKKYLQGKLATNKINSDSESDDDKQSEKISSELNVLKQSINKMTQNVSDITDEINILEEKSNSIPETNNTDSKNQHKYVNISMETEAINLNKKVNDGISKNKYKKQKLTNPKATKLLATSNWVVETIETPIKEVESKPPLTVDISTAFDSLEETVAGQVHKKLRSLKHQIIQLEKKSKADKNKKNTKHHSEPDNLEYLKLKTKKLRPVIDEELIETGSKDLPSEELNDPAKVLSSTARAVPESVDSDIDPHSFITVKPKFLNTALPSVDNEMDLLDDEEQVVPRVNIEEVFEEDDVVASFRQEKEDEINKDKPQEIDLSLPGWGTWGGKGVKAPKRKRNRFILKPAPKMPRRDENKGDIIIKEYKDPKLSVHKVKDVPFPFASLKDYEASIRAPLGNTFIPEKAHKMLIRPSVITKAGTVIQPMDEDELLLKKNIHYRNENVLKVLGQK